MSANTFPSGWTPLPLTPMSLAQKVPSALWIRLNPLICTFTECVTIAAPLLFTRMFIAVVFKTLKSTQVHIFGRIDKLWYIHRMEPPTKTIWSDLDEYHKRSQSKTLHTVWFHLYQVQK